MVLRVHGHVLRGLAIHRGQVVRLRKIDPIRIGQRGREAEYGSAVFLELHRVADRVLGYAQHADVALVGERSRRIRRLAVDRRRLRTHRFIAFRGVVILGHRRRRAVEHVKQRCRLAALERQHVFAVRIARNGRLHVRLVRFADDHVIRVALGCRVEPRVFELHAERELLFAVRRVALERLAQRKRAALARIRERHGLFAARFVHHVDETGSVLRRLGRVAIVRIVAFDNLIARMRRDVGDARAHRLSVRAHGDAHRSGVNVVPVALLVRLCQTVHAAGHGARLRIQQVEVVFIPQLHVKGERLAVALIAPRSRKRFRNRNRSDIALVGERVADDIRLFVVLRLGRFERVALVCVLLAHRFRHDDIRAVRNVIDHRRLALLQGDRLYVLPSEIDRCRLAVHRVGVLAVNRLIGQRIVLLFDSDVKVKRIALVGHLAEHVLRDAHAVRVAHVGDLNRGGRFFRNRSLVLFGRAAVPVRIADGKAHVAIRLFVLDNDIARPFRQVLKGHDLAVMQAQRQRHRLADPLLFHRIRFRPRSAYSSGRRGRPATPSRFPASG